MCCNSACVKRQAPGTSAVQKIERRRWGITIRRGGSHRQTQPLERSLRARSPVLGDFAVLCSDFLYAEGCAILGLVQSYFAGESPCAEFHRASRRNYCRNLLSIHWRGGVPLGRDPARFRGNKTVLSQFANRGAVGVDRSIYYIGGLLATCAAVSFAGLARRLQHPRAGRMGRIRSRRRTPRVTPQRSWSTRYASPVTWNLRDHADPRHRAASHSSCPGDGSAYATHVGKPSGMASAPEAEQIGPQGKTGDQ